MVLVSGEAGIGKTSLVREFCDHAHGSGRVLWGSCDVLFTPRPLGPFVDVAEAAGGDAGGRRRDAAPFPTRSPRRFGVCSSSARRRSSCSRTSTLRTRRRSTSCGSLARRSDGLPALVIATYRDDGLDRWHPLRIVLGEIAARFAESTGSGSRRSRARRSLSSPRRTARTADELYRQDGREPVLRHRGARGAGRGDPRHRPRRGARSRRRGSVPGRGGCSTRSRWRGSQAELRLLDALASDCQRNVWRNASARASLSPGRGRWRSPMSWRDSRSRSRSPCIAASRCTALRWRRWSRRPSARRTPRVSLTMPTRPAMQPRCCSSRRSPASRRRGWARTERPRSTTARRSVLRTSSPWRPELCCSAVGPLSCS